MLNNRDGTRGFTCPVCRLHHDIQSIPGFENETSSQPPPRQDVAGRPQTAILHLLSDIFPHTRSQRHANNNEHPVEIEIEATTVSNADPNDGANTQQGEEEDDDDDETYRNDDGNNSVFHVKTRTFNLTIQSFTLTQR